MFGTSKVINEHLPIIPALRGLKQEDQEFEASLGYIVSSKPAWAT
jgi:hypothetical protein